MRSTPVNGPANRDGSRLATVGPAGAVDGTLREVARQAAAGDVVPAMDTIVELARPDRIRRLINCVLDHPGALARCAPASFFHVLGFAKFVLVNGEPDYMLRMHVWQPDGSRPPGHIHNHRDVIVSAVVRGTLEKHIFVRDPTATGFIEFREELDADNWTLRQIGRTGLRRVQVTRLERGSHYALAPEVLHRIRADHADVTITLMLETAPAATTTAVFTADNEQPAQRLPKVPLTTEGYREGLRAALMALQV